MKKVTDYIREAKEAFQSEKQRLADEARRRAEEKENKRQAEERERERQIASAKTAEEREARAKMEALKTIPLSIVTIFLLTLICGVIGYTIGVFAGVARNGLVPACGSRERTEIVEKTANGFAGGGMVLGGMVGIYCAIRRYNGKEI